MAKRVAQKIKSVQGRSGSTGSSSRGSGRSTSSRSTIGGWNYRSFFNKVLAAPATPYVAGGIGLAVIARFAYKYYQSHPEMMDSFKENLDLAEEKLKDFGSKIASSVESDSDSDSVTH